ncbi:CPBP family intramembrane glutamic endopeptidase [Oceanobacillus halophilus]|uniref:CPBP family intramembrane metalloprotease n=1 Tax=Oceanobacillus halophilus TaxID=930130 RepID=A0A495ACI6_9BACI|nr:CPBP family intramembrane glutamic endopeptidase [Oceanobacillus halophilus]RKQ37689.1 CPBP family intramembrane metalloprotease [Oceanobacillus halophilus]
MKQSEIIKRLSDKELKKQVFLSQGLLLIVGVGLSFIFFDTFADWNSIMGWKPKQILFYGVIPGLGIVLLDIFIMRIFPEKHYDDGGINKRIFKNQSIGFIFVLSSLVAISEELLFRGVLQSVFGYLIASILFAVVHFRYFTKPVLLLSIFSISFLIGYLFEVTNNLYVTIAFHFTVDFVLGLIIRFKL